ncbi:MFS transporter [Streptomyces lateritius]|uniref:MFS transporter n=1 Tax=Streptomyces lateritius TaxID=67313 RepID=A0ABW6Y7R6_9ACTN
MANFGLVSGVSAVFATVFNPVAGALSDRSGRRNPWILAGGLLAIPVMFLLGSVHTILLVMIAWCLGQAVVNVSAVDTALVTMVLPKAEDSARDMGALNVANAGPQIVAPFVASLIVSASGGYTALFVVAAVLSVPGALAVRPIRTVR